MFKRTRPLVSAFVLALLAVAAALPAAYAHAVEPAQQHAAQALELNSHASSTSSHWQVQALEEQLLDFAFPRADAAALSNYWQNHILDFLMRGQTLTAPTTIFVGLDTTSGSASACGTEVTGGSYARVSVSSSLANWAGTQGAGTTTASSGTSGQTSNNNAITFPAPTAAWGTIVGFCFFDASSGGNMLLFAPLTVSKSVNSGDAAPSFAAAALTWTLT